MKKLGSRDVIYALLLFFVFFFAGNGILGLTHPDEVFYSQTAQEMIQHKTWIVPYLFDGPNFEKPIFSYWLFILGFKMFGVSSFSARFFPAVFAVLGILGVYFLGKTAFRDEKKGLYAALVLMSSLLYVGLARTVFTDMFFTVLIELSLVFFYWGYAVPEKKSWGILLFWIFAGLAVLAKGILGLCIPFAVIILFLAVKKELKFILNLPFLLGLGLFLVISVPWYAFMIKTFGQSFINEFFYNDHVRRIVEAEHVTNDKWFFYPLSMIVLMAPWCLFVVWALIRLVKKIGSKTEPVYLFLVCWLLVVFTVFQCAHSKLVSYIFPLFPAMALATGDLIARIIDNPKSRKWFVMSALFFPVLVFAATAAALKVYAEHIPFKEIVLQLLAVYFVVVVAAAAFLWNKDGRFVRMAIVMAQVPLLLAVVLSAHRIFEDYATSKNPSGYLLSKYEGDAPLLSSRMYLRAVRFFTQKKVVWLDLNDKKFFSPHPVEKLTDSQSVQVFLRKFPVVYGVVNKKDMKQLQSMIIATHAVQVLSVFGDEYVIKVNPVSLKLL